MTFGDEAPEAAVLTVVAVVAHHPVVVHLAGVAVGLFAVDVYLAVLHLEGVVFVGGDETAVEGQVVERELEGLTLGGDVDWTVVVDRPALSGMREEGAGGVDIMDIGAYRLDVARGEELFGDLGREGHSEAEVAKGVVGVTVDVADDLQDAVDFLFCHSALLEDVDGEVVDGEGHLAVKHCTFGCFDRLAIDVDDAVDDLEVFARETHAAFDVMLAFVEGACHHFARRSAVFVARGVAVDEVALAGQHGVAAAGSHGLIVGALAAGEVADDGVALGKIEHDGVVALHMGVAREAIIGQLRPGEVRLEVGADDGIVHQRQRQGGHDDAGTVGHLADEQVVAHTEAALHTRGGDREELEDEAADEHHGDEGEDNGFRPVAELADLRRGVGLGVVIGPALLETHHEEVDGGQQDAEGLLPKALPAEDFGGVDHHQEEDEDVQSGKEKIDIPGPFLAAELYPDDDVVEGHQGLPRGPAGFLEDKPQSGYRTQYIKHQKNFVNHFFLFFGFRGFKGFKGFKGDGGCPRPLLTF